MVTIDNIRCVGEDGPHQKLPSISILYQINTGEMKRLMVKSSLVGLADLQLIAMNADAQRSGKKRNQQSNPQNQTQQQSVNDNKQPSGYNPYGNIPIVVDTSGVSDNTVKKSLRNDNALNKTGLMERTPLPYEHLRWEAPCSRKKYGVKRPSRKNKPGFSI